MAAEVSADLTLIQDEDVLRRMWAETEDLGRKKEIRARMYRLREQRLRDFYTTGEVVSEITGRKHATTTHTESIGDQGFLTMKSKEIRDSESPTRDFSRRANNGYWQSVDEKSYTSGNQDGTAIDRREESRRGEGVVIEGNAETRMALSAQNIHEKTSKSDDNMSVKSETNQQSQKFASVTESDDKSSRKETSESQNSQSYHEQKTSQSSSASTKISSTTSSSRKVVSSSVTSKYQIIGGEKHLIDTDVKAITSGDDYSNFASNLRSELANVHESNHQTSTVVQDEINNSRFQQPQEQLISDTQDVNVTKSSTQQTSHDSKHSTSQRTNEAYNTVEHYTTNYSTNVENDGSDTNVIEIENRYRPVDSRSGIVETIVKDSSTKNEQNIQRTKNVSREEEISRAQKQNEISDYNEFITNEKIDSSTFERKIPKSRTETPSVNEKVVDKYTTVREVSNDTRDSSINQTQVHSHTDQKIMNEINKLDTYLQHQNTPAPSEPATPRTVTDGAQWTVVSNRDERGEFVYHNDNSPRDSAPLSPVQTTREQPIKHPSSLDLPKDATDGQYVTTYQQSYNRISVDNSPSHEFFVRTLRASPDRLTPSPTKSSRGSLDRNSPDRKLRATSKGSLDRSSPETCKRRSYSKGSLDRSTPDRTYRTSPSKTPERERRGSSESYTIDRKKDARRKTTEITQQMVKDTTNKTRRKFSSTQQKAANKTRVSTPGVSPSTSPTRTVTKKEVTSGSESDISQATYNKTSSISSFRDEKLTTTKAEKREYVTEQPDDHESNVQKKSTPREKSPEYSSEGSVSREINKSITSRSELSTKNNSFKPIKHATNEDTNDNFILEEQRNVVNENITTESYDTKKQVSTDNVNQKDTIEITDVTDCDSDTQHIPHPEDSVNNQSILTQNKAIIEKTVVEEQRAVAERSTKGKSPTSSPERRPKETKKTEADVTRPKSHPENINTNAFTPKTSFSPERKLTDRQPLRQLNQKRPSDSPSTTDRNPKTSTQYKPTENINKRPVRPSPERRQSSSRSPERESKKKPLDENRRSVSSSPERRLIHVAHKSTVKTNQTASSTFISEETKIETRERSVSSSPERKPVKQTPKTSHKTTDKSPISRQQKPSPSSSPERNVSPERKVKPATTKRENTPTNNQQTPTSATPSNQRLVQKTTTKETVRTTRYSSIPRANKLSPRNSKDKIETSNNKIPTQIIRKATPIPRSAPTTRLTSVTRVNKITEQKQDTVKSSQIKPSNGTRKPIETTPKRTPSKIATPKSIPTKPRNSEASNNKPSTHRIPRLNDSPLKTTIKKRTTQTPVNKKRISNNEIETTKVTLTNKTTSENDDFLQTERSILDLEDENPPEEFYAEYDDRTDDTSPERQPKSIRTIDNVSVNVSKTVKTTTKETKQGSPTVKSSVKPTPKVSKPKQEVNLPKTTPTTKNAQKIRETNKTRKTSRKLKTERKTSKDYESSSSSSSSEEEEIEHSQVLENDSLIENNQVTHESIQDLLTVVVQHPKSSRESSPGYPSANQPFCTTSEDGDSNPRYADYITEPDDVEVFDDHHGTGTPIRLTEDESADVKSVADRVNVFLEATRVTQEIVHQPEPVVSSPKSVLKAKTMFENIAKNQVSSNQHPDKAPKSPHYNITPNHYPNHPIDQDKIISQKRQIHDDVSVNEKINIERDVSKSFIEKELITQEHMTEDDDETILTESIVNEKRPSSSNIPEKHSTVSVDVTSKKDYFERRQQEEVEIHDEIKNDLKCHVVKEVISRETVNAPFHPEDIPSKRIINERKSPSPQRESPKTGSNVVPVTKKTPEKKISTTVGTKKKIFENTAEETEIRETENTPYHPEDTTTKRSTTKQKSPSPQRQLPKTPDSKKSVDKKSSTTFVRKQSVEYTNDDSQSRLYEDIQINETLKNPYQPEDSTPKRNVNKQKSPSPQRQSPKTNTTSNNKKPIDKKSSTIVDTKKRLFENTTEEIEIRETIGHVEQDDTTPRRNVTKQKSLSPHRQQSKPFDPIQDSKKSVDKKPSIVGTRKQSFERTTEDVNIVEQKNNRNTVEDSSIRKQTSQTDITKRRPSIKEKSPSPQRAVPKQKETVDLKKSFERKKSGPVVDVSSKKDFFEKKVKDISIAALKTKPQTPKFSKPSRPNPDISETELQRTDKTFSGNLVRSHSPDKNDENRHTDEEEEVISETTRKVSHSQDIKQTFSKTEQVIRKISESDQSDKLIKSEITHQRPLDIEQPTKKPSKVENVERKSTKTEEIVRKTSKPQEIIYAPSKTDTKVYTDSRSYNRNESSLKSTTTSSTRGQTPDRQPDDIIRKFSKPEEVTRKPSKPEEITRKPSNTEDITRKVSRPAEVVRKPSKPENPYENTSKPEEIIRRPTSRTDSYTKSSTISTVRSHTHDHQATENIRKTPKNDSPDYKRPKAQDAPRTSSRLDYNESDVTDDAETYQTVTESYMKSTVSSSVRGQTPEKQYRGNTPERNTQNRPRSPLKSDDPRRRPSETEEVLEETATRRTSTRTETKQEVGGKFGVTLRKTPSSGKITTKTIQRQNSRPAEIDIESIFDLELLEEMLLKAVGYDDRRRIRAQIRLVKKQIEEEKSTTITTKVTKSTSSIQSSLPSVRDIKRQDSPSKSPERQENVRSSPRSSPERREPSRRSPTPSPERRQQRYSSPRASPERRERVHASPRASPERYVKTSSPEKRSPDRTTTRRVSSEKTTINGYTESRTITEKTTVRTQSVRKSTSSDVKETCPTDLITSSYGVGPTDENGKPLFGLRALRRTSTNKTLIDDNVEHETITQEEEESSLFGLKALQTTETMPAESSQLRELVERHQQYVRQSSAKDLQPVQKPKAKLRDSFILTQDENVTPVLQSGTEEIPKGLSLKSIIQKHENKNGSNIQSSMESKSTVVKSRSSVSSDGKVSLHRDVIHGEVSSKNNEEPVGKITRSSYSYQSPKDKDSLPSVTSSTTTSLIGNRRSSGPKIEEITDSDSTFETNRRYSKEYTVEEDDTVVDRRSSAVSVEGNVKTYTSILKNSGESGRRSSGPRITDVSDVNSEQQERRTSITKTISSRVSPDIAEVKPVSANRQQSFKNEENKTETQKKVITRGDSVKALQHKFQQATEAANQPSSRPYPRAGLILRSNTLQQIDDQTQMSSSMKHSSVERTSSKSKQDMKETKETKSHEVSSSPVLKTEVITHQDSEVVRSVQDSRSEEPTSFLDNRTKVTGVQDILTRMRNADLVTEKTDSTEDAEARALLNKFLGASVILQGMEQGMRAAQKQPETEGAPTSPSSAALVIQAEKQRVKATAVRTVEDDIDEIQDEKQLRILLDACSDYEGRRKLRARLRTIMAEQKGGPEDVEESHGEFLGLRNIDDSGIESGEDLKGVNPEVMKEVEEALVRLECILPGLDVSRREAVSKLVNSLQSCLRLPPRRRITIGVSPGELAAARKWLKPPLEEMIVEHVNYCPVLQRPGYLMEPAPQKGILSYIPKTERSLSDSGSLQDYDPSLRLFTPEQTVQIAIHKAAIKKQISQEGKRRESSDDGDVSSGEESCEVNNYNEVSSAQRLLQIATENAKKNPSAARFHNRSSKKLKMKRANTIDIPKPANFFEYSSGDEYGASADEVSIDVERKHHHKEIKFLPPTFEPKTENDLKFLAFLKQVNENQPKMQTYNPSARGGKHWSNRFSSIKTAFEQTEQPKMSVPSPAKMFWQNSEAHQNNECKDQYKNKLPWTVKTGDNGVVVGSLTVAKPGHVNNFNHAPKSAFKPIEKKPVSTVSGTVKQIAAQKFSVSDSETEKKPEKNSKKQTNVSHPHTTYSPNTKQNTFVNNTSSAFKKYNSSPQSNNSEKPHSKSTTHPSTNGNYTSFKCFDTSDINNGKSMNVQKYNITQNKASLSNLQSNIKSCQYNTSTQPYANNGYPSKSQQNTLAAKKQFMQVSSNSTPQNSGYKLSTHITNHQDNNNHSFGHSLPISYAYQPTSCNTEFQNNDYQKSSQNISPKKNEYKISYQISNPSNNGYQTSSYSKSLEQSMLHSSNEVVPPQNISSKPISKNINDSSGRYPFSSSVNPNMYSDGDYKHSPTLHLEKNNFKIENNDDFPIIGDNKQKISKNDIYSSASGYSNFSENSDNIFKQNNYLDPLNFKNKPYTAYIYSSNSTANSSDSFDQRSDIPLISTDKPNHITQTTNDSPLLIKEDLAPSSPYSLSVSSSLDRMSPQRISSIKFPEDNRYLSPSYQSMSPSLRIDEDESPWGSVMNGDDSPLEEKAVSRVMGQAQCQQAVTVNNRTRRRFDLDLESELKLQVRQSAQKKSLSPSFPNVIQKSESWHQMVKEQMQQAKQAPPLPKISKAKSSHTLALPKQYEAALSQDTITQKKITVSQYLSKQSKATRSTKANPKYKSTNTINIQQDDDELADVDEVFENIFQESNKKRNKSSESSSEVVRKGDGIVKTEVHTRTTSSARLTKANSVQSPFAKFRQLERQNSAPSAGRPPPLFKFTEPKLAQSASTIKERLLNWVQAQTRHYKNIQIENFSTSWSNGLAFCALIHHFCPHAFDYDSLTPEKRRYNFELAFRVAEEEADIFPLLDVEDMVVMKKPDWKCVFTYVQSIYRRFHDSPDALPVF